MISVDCWIKIVGIIVPGTNSHHLKKEEGAEMAELWRKNRSGEKSE